MQNPEEPNAEQEPNAEHHVAKILVEVLILRSISGPLKRKLMAFSCHIQLSRVPPRCVMLWRSPEMNFTRRPRVAKLLCIGSPLNRSRDITYCSGEKVGCDACPRTTDNGQRKCEDRARILKQNSQYHSDYQHSIYLIYSN